MPKTIQTPTAAESGEQRLSQSRKNGMLFAAVAAGSVKEVQAALDAGGAAMFPNPENGMTALMQAAKAGDAQKVAALLPFSDPAQRTVKDGVSGHTALIWAMAQGHLPCVELLAPKTPASLAYDSDQKNALMFAASRGRADCVKILLPFFDCSETNKHGLTALAFAAAFGRLECLRTLLPLSDANAADEDGETPLMRAAADGDVPSVELLLGASDPRAKNHDGKNAFDHAVALRRWPAADLLSEFAPDQRVAEVFATAGREKLPRCAARMEAKELESMVFAESSKNRNPAEKDSAPQNAEPARFCAAKRPARAL